MVPNLCYPACDVRDVAGAHITAMTSPTAPGKHNTFNPRLLLKSNNKSSFCKYCFLDLLNQVEREFRLAIDLLLSGNSFP